MSEQMGSQEGKKIEIGIPLILSNKETVVDFFGDNRNTWYQALLRGGSTFGRVSLDSKEDFTTDDEIDLPPLNSEAVTENRAENIAAFFRENHEAAEEFREYYERDMKRVAAAEEEKEPM